MSQEPTVDEIATVARTIALSLLENGPAPRSALIASMCTMGLSEATANEVLFGGLSWGLFDEASGAIEASSIIRGSAREAALTA